jgi:hypothetical protein
LPLIFRPRQALGALIKRNAAPHSIPVMLEVQPHRHRAVLGEKYTCRVRICFEVSFAFEEFLLREEMSLQ